LIKPPTVYLIDTSAWIEAIRPAGDKVMAERIRSYNTRGQSAWCSMVRLELWNGARGQQETAFLKYLETSIIELPIHEEVWHLADQLARHARQTGKTFPSSDLLIAACARFHGAEIVHKDRHFDQLKAL
jgi:predicted nucleic acid-binding protein